MYGFVNGNGERFCDACFTGNYPVALGDEARTRQLHLFEARDR
jgi:glutamine phosphoribosylpyrophosphate amidotransferase